MSYTRLGRGKSAYQNRAGERIPVNSRDANRSAAKTFILELTKEGVNPEGIELESDGDWKSASDRGWLKEQSGKWKSVGPTGSRMYGGDGKRDIGYLVAFWPGKAKEGQTGKFQDLGNGDNGEWAVKEIA